MIASDEMDRRWVANWCGDHPLRMCPFCGEPAEALELQIDYSWQGAERWQVACRNVCAIKPRVKGPASLDVSRAWNRRRECTADPIERAPTRRPVTRRRRAARVAGAASLIGFAIVVVAILAAVLFGATR